MGLCSRPVEEGSEQSQTQGYTGASPPRETGPPHCSQSHLSFLLSSPEDLSDTEEMFPKDITKWSSNDLMDKIESPEPEDTQGQQVWGCCRAWGGRLQGFSPLLSDPAPAQCWTYMGIGGPQALLVTVAASVRSARLGCPLAHSMASVLLQMVCTARAPLSSGWPPVWSS